jgi:pyridoxine 5-phosphate synthase
MRRIAGTLSRKFMIGPRVLLQLEHMKTLSVPAKGSIDALRGLSAWRSSRLLHTFSLLILCMSLARSRIRRSGDMHGPETGMPAKLSVNLNAIAMLRNRRDLPWPSVVGLGRIALAAGAHGLTVHPRPDQRHTRNSDLPEIRALIDDEFPQAEFNIEGYPTEDFLTLVERAAPDQVTFVPDDPLQATSDHGWNIEANKAVLLPALARMQEAGIRVSLFINADPAAATAAAAVHADRVELYTGPYGAALDPKVAAVHLAALTAAADAARAGGIAVNAGHDLNLVNLPPLRKAIPDLAEVSIGHAVTADALIYGMAETVRKYRAICGG